LTAGRLELFLVDRGTNFDSIRFWGLAPHQLGDKLNQICALSTRLEVRRRWNTMSGIAEQTFTSAQAFDIG
jgi:hypothetical protein